MCGVQHVTCSVRCVVVDENVAFEKLKMRWGMEVCVCVCSGRLLQGKHMTNVDKKNSQGCTIGY